MLGRKWIGGKNVPSGFLKNLNLKKSMYGVPTHLNFEQLSVALIKCSVN